MICVMETPSPPKLRQNERQNCTDREKTVITRETAERTAKTPFQSASFHPRPFKSELQPNRISSRFNVDKNNIKSTTRHHPSSSLRPNGDANFAIETKNPILSRLGNQFAQTSEPPRRPIVEIKPSVPKILDARRQQPLLATTTPANSLRLQAKSQSYTSTQSRQHEQRLLSKPALSSQPAQAPPIPQANVNFTSQKLLQQLHQQPQPMVQHKSLPSLQIQPQLLSQPSQQQQKTQPHYQQQHSHCQQQQSQQQQQTQFQTQPKTREYLYQSQSRLGISSSSQNQVHTKHLIQDTRGPNQQVGTVATCTKAPLSVSQYTQPTPLPANKSSHQITRAQSEPSIKYQVQVNDKTYKILRKIGSGGSAKVYEGFESKTSQTVAIKIINVAQADPRTQESYFNEKSLLKSLRDSKYVVRMFDYEYKADVKELVIVMEKGDADLSQVIDSYFRHRDGRIDGLFVKFYWRGMLLAVNSIHQHGIVHADLKPVNFILVKNEIKLIDFGIASAVDPGGTSIIRDYQIGTINYMSPESLRNRALDASFQQSKYDDFDENDQPNKRTVIKYNTKADIWSLGCILYNLVYGRPPFDKYKDIISKAQAITDPRNVINFPKISNQNLLNCMMSCLRYNPADRPTAEELLNHPYLREDIITLQND